ncbi:hypothetical protein [Rhodoferax sp. PAMC 29310]|uniref:hypothetical protein n=1 Tax=Rhodoferax sp. PAMC 29310 TaxID=2822760 RepID=UPI001B3192C3|nr:hypothetical protein [Rhodoferax sp. PAMC 29310]
MLQIWAQLILALPRGFGLGGITFPESANDGLVAVPSYVKTVPLTLRLSHFHERHAVNDRWQHQSANHGCAKTPDIKPRPLMPSIPLYSASTALFNGNYDEEALGKTHQ